MAIRWMVVGSFSDCFTLTRQCLFIVTDLCVFYLGFETAVVAVFYEVIDVDACEEDLDLEIDVCLGRQPDLVVDELVVDGE